MIRTNGGATGEVFRRNLTKDTRVRRERARCRREIVERTRTDVRKLQLNCAEKVTGARSAEFSLACAAVRFIKADSRVIDGELYECSPLFLGSFMNESEIVHEAFSRKRTSAMLREKLPPLVLMLPTDMRADNVRFFTGLSHPRREFHPT